MHKVIALDLEGTLISNGVSQIPRPGLYPFLKTIRSITDDIVLFTTLNKSLTQQIQNTLSDEQSVPQWFRSLPYVDWEGKWKDIAFVEHLYQEPVRAILIDDHKLHMEGQEDQVILIEQFASPYEDDDVLWDFDYTAITF